MYLFNGAFGSLISWNERNYQTLLKSKAAKNEVFIVYRERLFHILLLRGLKYMFSVYNTELIPSNGSAKRKLRFVKLKIFLTAEAKINFVNSKTNFVQNKISWEAPTSALPVKLKYLRLGIIKVLKSFGKVWEVRKVRFEQIRWKFSRYSF